MRINHRIGLSIVILLAVLSDIRLGYSQDGLIGTFYGGWSRNKGNYIWTKDLGQGAQFVGAGDVNGDGFEDAVVATNGQWEIALSEAYVDLAGKTVRHFGIKETWISDFGSDADNFLLGDLNGNAKTDIAIFYQTSGNWEFAASDGTAFLKSAISIQGFGSKSSHQFLADVNGDGLADAITYAEGTWKVSANNGSGFDTPQVFITGFGNAEAQPFLADVNGNGYADAIYVLNNAIHVALSDGSAFISSPNAWLTGLSFDRIMFADANGDNFADAIFYHEHYQGIANQGRWEFAPSNGAGTFSDPVFWCQQHGSADPRGRPMKGLPAGHNFFTAYVNTSKSGSYGVSPIVFNNDWGLWQVMPPYELFSNQPGQPGNQPWWYNSWHTHSRAALPLIGNEYYGYDAEVDTFAITAIIKELADAEIDYVLLDQTNTWGVLLKAYQVFAHTISEWNKIPDNRKVKYAICGMYKNHAGEVEVSAERTISDFYNHPVFGGEGNYQYLDGKPLMVCYGGVQNKHLDWASYTGKKSNASQFTLKWMDGRIRESTIGPEKGDWFGWFLPEGTIENSTQMVVQPGFHSGPAGNNWSSRWVDGIEGDRYRKLGWDKVLLNQPEAVTIISLVGDAEQNDVYHMRTGDYTHDMGKTEHWSYPEMYWEMTKDYISNYRKLRAGELECFAEYGREKIVSNNLIIYFTKDFPVHPVVYVSLEGESKAMAQTVEITSVTPNSFSVKLSDIEHHDYNLSWLAVLPGYWETPNGMKLAAGKSMMGEKPIQLEIEDHFDAPPALFSILNSNNNHTASVIKQSSVTEHSFNLELIVPPLADISTDEKVGWIALETGKSDMWSGRFCTALTIANVGEGTIDFTLPRYFYGKILTLVKSSNGPEDSNVAPIVESTTNLGGRISYQSASAPPSDTLNVIGFDGGGGRLYGYKTRLHE